MTTALLNLDFIADPGPTEVAAIHGRLRSFNQARSGLPDGRSFAIVLRDPDGTMQGAVCASLWANMLHINALWTDETLRGQGEGTRLMLAAEDHARRQGAKFAYLETLSFQARPFYERLGYMVFGELPEIADGVRLYFMRKPLVVPTPSNP